MRRGITWELYPLLYKILKLSTKFNIELVNHY